MTAGPAELPGIAAAPIQLDEATALRFIEQSQSLLCVATRDGAIDYMKAQFDPEEVSRRYGWVFEYDSLTVPV